MTTRKSDIPRIETGVRNLDAVINGGVPKGSVTVIAGPPGSGKTILTQQICFHNASEKSRVLYFGTLSEPIAKTLLHLKQFDFFDPRKLGSAMEFVDLGVILRGKGLEQASALIMEHVKRVKPALVVIDSFKVFDDLAKSPEERRKFAYELAIKLMAWEVTAFLLGEYSLAEYEHNPLFSIIDSLMILTQRESSGEHQRFFQVRKMRGTDHSRDELAFVITSQGIELFAPRTLQRSPEAGGGQDRCKTHISKLDDLLGDGIPLGSSLLVAGVAGTGKTVLALEFIYRGAVAGERGIFFSFEETKERLRATAEGLGWDLDREMKRGMLELVFIPQPEIMVERHLLMMRERVEAMKAQRVAIDSMSVFLHKLKDPLIVREKVFHLATIVQNAHAVGFFATDVPYGSTQLSRWGVEETVVDGVILLSSTEEELNRQRYIEIYKLRNTGHLKGRHSITVGPGGLSVFPRYHEQPGSQTPPPTGTRRLRSGVEGLDELLGGGLLERSVTLVPGSAGAGKSVLATQFIVEGALHGAPGLYVTLEEGPAQLLASADALGLPLRKMVKKGAVEIFHVSRDWVRAGQLLAVLSDKIQELGARRLVFDSVTQLDTEQMSADQLEQVLEKMLNRFKSLGVTSLLTLESHSLYSMEHATEEAVSPIADNLLVLRYRRDDERLEPTLTVVKTRGSDHDRGTHPLTIGQGGMRVGPPGKEKPARKKAR